MTEFEDQSAVDLAMDDTAWMAADPALDPALGTDDPLDPYAVAPPLDPYASEQPIDPYGDPGVTEDPMLWDPAVLADDAQDLPNFDPQTATPVAGDPEAAMENWHLQEQPDTCGVASQEFVLEALTGQPFEESELAAEAQQNGWYQPTAGTPLMCVDNLLEAHGVPTEAHFNGTIEAITPALNEGNHVIAMVDSSELWEPGQDPFLDDMQGEPIPGQSPDHFVEVTGVVDTAEGPMVVLNDPGHPDGRGAMVPVAEFESAWADSDSAWIKAGPTADDSIDAFAGPALVT